MSENIDNDSRVQEAELPVSENSDTVSQSINTVDDESIGKDSIEEQQVLETSNPNTDLPVLETTAPTEPVEDITMQEVPKEEDPTTEEPTQEEQTKEEQTKEEQTKEEQTKEEQTKEEQTKEQPTKEQPTKEQPTKEQPTKEQPTQEQPTQEQPSEPQTDDITTFITSEPVNEEIQNFSDDEINVDDVSSSDDSSSDDSDSEDSSSDDSSDEEEDENEANRGDIDYDDDQGDANEGPVKSVHEVEEKAPTLPEGYEIPSNAPIEEIGEITGLVENTVIIKAKTSGEFRVLQEKSVFCLEDRTIIGPLFEIFGRVQQPVYSVKFNSKEDFEKFKDCKGKAVYYVVPDSQFLYTDSIKNIKGTDASNCHDEELPEEEQEYSDDEKESAAKQARKKKKKGKEKRPLEQDTAPSAKRRDVPSYAPINSREQRGRPQTNSVYNSYQQPTQPASQYGQPYYPQTDHYGSVNYQQPTNTAYNLPNNQYQSQPQYNQPPQYNSQQYPQQQYNQPLYPQQQYNQQQYNQQQYSQPQYPQQQQQQYSQPPLPTDPAQLEQLQRLLLQHLQNQNQNNLPPYPPQ